ncbi:MAG: hypothetical protein H0T65_03470 [Deltaproteobacteria bacterium]|nr:hypothetical protein [Deltaproteobacteria bacterium]
MNRILPIVIVLAACSAEDRRSPPPAKKALQSMNATQHDLALELDRAAENGTWIELRRRWQGQKLQWTVTRQRMLCASAERCNVAAFPIKNHATHGWMPELKFAPGQYEALAAKCGDAAQCEVTIEGVVAKLEASDESPTRIVLDGVSLVADRTAQK